MCTKGVIETCIQKIKHCTIDTYDHFCQMILHTMLATKSMQSHFLLEPQDSSMTVWVHVSKTSPSIAIRFRISECCWDPSNIPIIWSKKSQILGIQIVEFPKNRPGETPSSSSSDDSNAAQWQKECPGRRFWGLKSSMIEWKMVVSKIGIVPCWKTSSLGLELHFCTSKSQTSWLCTG